MLPLLGKQYQQFFVWERWATLTFTKMIFFTHSLTRLIFTHRQQRHRSALTSPLSKEVMFKGNPRNPGSLSFEKIRFVLDDGRMSRLQEAWRQTREHPPCQSSQRSAKNQDAMERLNDEWIVAHLSSCAMTGLRHELDVLVGFDILSIDAIDGRIALKEGWEQRLPHAILIEMRQAWGPNADKQNLYCIHNKITSSMAAWKHPDGAWRFTRSTTDDKDEDELVFEDEEYWLRERIFTENYTDWVCKNKGIGEFGV